MKEQIEAALANVSSQFRDRRVQHCQVIAPDVSGFVCELKGTVLDEGTLTAVTTHLRHEFPDITLHTTNIHVLRQPDNPILTVGTNLASLHGQPGRTSEQWSQLLNGWQVEQLLQGGDWCYVRQPDGYLGWVYAPYLTREPSSQATHMVCEPVSLLRVTPTRDVQLVSRVLGGTAVSVTTIEDEWAHIVLAGGKQGWLPLSALRGMQAMVRDGNGRRQQIVTDASNYIGVPYLWGGLSAHGIDCSGLSQLLHLLAGVTLPRDADMQFDQGIPVEAPFRPGDLLFFGSQSGHRSISHVGISLGGWQMIHASGPRNGVYVDDVQAVSWLKDIFLGARTFLKEPSTVY